MFQQVIHNTVHVGIYIHMAAQFCAAYVAQMQVEQLRHDYRILKQSFYQWVDTIAYNV